jgi:hypothetical protein
MSDFSTGDFILQPVKPKPLQTVKHITIGEHNVPFTIERNDAGTITHYTGVLLTVQITLRESSRMHGIPHYDIELSSSNETRTHAHVNDVWLNTTVSASITDLCAMSPVDAWRSGLCVPFYADTSCTYETYAGYIRTYFSADRQLFCYERSDSLDDLPDVEWRAQHYAVGLFALGYGVYDTALYTAGIPHLQTILSHIKKVSDEQ